MLVNASDQMLTSVDGVKRRWAATVVLIIFSECTRCPRRHRLHHPVVIKQCVLRCTALGHLDLRFTEGRISTSGPDRYVTRVDCCRPFRSVV